MVWKLSKEGRKAGREWWNSFLRKDAYGLSHRTFWKEMPFKKSDTRLTPLPPPLPRMTDVKALAQQFKLVSHMPDVHVYFPDKKKPQFWHVSFMGSDDSPFSEGIYHIAFDFTNYPNNGPTVIALNDNGGYEVGQSLCIVGITSGNSSTWTPGT